jgi:hypothetical protein
MIREITAPLAIKSENKIRGRNWHAIHRASKKTKEIVAQLLGQHFPQARHYLDALEPPTRNRFTITLTRHSAGRLDDDNLRGAFKDTRDAVAFWLGFRKKQIVKSKGERVEREIGEDTHACLTWHYDQASAPKGQPAVTIRIEDDDRGLEDVIVQRSTLPGDSARPPVPPPAPLDVKPSARARKPKADKANGQHALVFRRAWVALPWEQDAGLDCWQNLHDIGALVADLGEPFVFDVIDPTTQRRVHLYQHTHEDPELGGRCWLYTAEVPEYVRITYELPEVLARGKEGGRWSNICERGEADDLIAAARERWPGVQVKLAEVRR